jgi:mxaJ protein
VKTISPRRVALGPILCTVVAAFVAPFAQASDGIPADPGTAYSQPHSPILTVCADPNNMPFSNRAGQGFENRIAELLAHDLGAQLRYFWWAQRRGFVRHTLEAAQCDLWPGVPAELENVAPSHPYYRSTYVFVTRADRQLQHLTLDDPRLRSLSLGVQMIGNDATNTPPAHAIARRGLTQNVHGYTVYGDYNNANPPAAIIEAVARDDIDVAVAWGPMAGYFASRSAVPLRVEPVTPAVDAGVLPMTYDISMGIRRNNPELADRINSLLAQEQPAIAAILRDYHVPLLPQSATASAVHP